MEHPTEHGRTRLVKLTSLTAAEVGVEIEDLLRTATVLHDAALDAWLSMGCPGEAELIAEVRLFNLAVEAVAVALTARFSGTPLGQAHGPDVSGALWLVAARIGATRHRS